MCWLYMALAGVNLVSGVLSIVTLTDGFIVYGIILFYYFLAMKVMYTESAPYRSNVRTDSSGANLGGTLSENLITGMAKNLKKQLPTNLNVNNQQ
jgi:hypothetical protein